ncbi:MAG: hypothetical protein JST42_23805, partial [Bacteroidetes bacterium]|nr:hypothetical protein [Bacteroidota bacterium]
VQVFRNVRPRQFVKIKEGVDRLNPVTLATLRLRTPSDSGMVGCTPVR